MAANLPVLEAFMADHSDRVDWVPPRAGTVAFARLLSGGPVDRFAEDLVAAQGVLILPGTAFGEPDDRFRLGFGRHDMPQGLERLGAFLSVRA